MYTTVKEIGRGGFGYVEEVLDDGGTRLARKTFSPRTTTNNDVREKLKKRFIREVKIQSEIGGQEIMPILDSDLLCQNPWFVMPLADGTLDEQIMSDKTAGIVTTEAIADVLSGLAFLHGLGYVHRDLNPKNVLLHEDTWKLSDFGATLPPKGDTVTLTDDTVIFTEKYCSPEQRSDFHGANSASDIYSFGCILHDYYGANERIPYSKQSAAGAMGIIIEKCTEPTPTKRPSIAVLQELVLSELVNARGTCDVTDNTAESWLERLSSIDTWEEKNFEEFARFFSELNIDEREEGHENVWVYSSSTPFLTRFSAAVLEYIVKKDDNLTSPIIEKYCAWASSTNFLFQFADSVCIRLGIIFDAGNPSQKAQSIVAMIKLAGSHNRWYAMREVVKRIESIAGDKLLSKRISIEFKIEECVDSLKHCLRELKHHAEGLPDEIQTLLA